MLIFIHSHSGSSTVARKTPVQQRSRRTVDRILDAAARILVDDGYSAVTTNGVAIEAGVSIGSLYQYFPNKEALFHALTERHLQDVTLTLAAHAERWRLEPPESEAWAAAFVEMLVAANDSELDRLLYVAAPPALPGPQLAIVVRQLCDEVAVQLARFGHRSDVQTRARVVVVSTLALVHEVVLPLRKGAGRRAAVAEVVRLVRLSVGARG